MHEAFQKTEDKRQKTEARTRDDAHGVSPSPCTERGPGGEVLSDAYRLAADLLAYPEDIDAAEIGGQVEQVARGLEEREGAETATLFRSFFEDWKAITPGEYIDTLELNPRCPLYLGYWAFLNEGPDSPPRRRFMGRLVDIYRRFDLSLGGKELPDFLPVVVEFLWISLGQAHPPERAGLIAPLPEDGQGEDDARRRVIEKFALPWVPSMIESLEKIGSPYRKLLKVIQALMEWDVRCYSDTEESKEVLRDA